MVILKYLRDKNLVSIFKFLYRINIFCRRFARLLVFVLLEYAHINLFKLSKISDVL